MANVPTNRDVKTFADVQNVVTSVILRQTDPFTVQDINKEVESKIKFSAFGKYGKGRKKINVEEKIDATLNKLFLLNCIKRDEKTQKYRLNIPFPAIGR